MPASGSREPEDVRLDELAVASRPPAARPRPRPGPVEHRRVDVDARDVVAGLGERDRQPSGAGGELEDRPAGPRREGEVEVEVARVVGEVEVVEPRERRGRGLGSAGGSVDAVTALASALARGPDRARRPSWRRAR